VTDVFSKEERSRIMARVRGSNTTPELIVRSLLHRLGLRFRLHRKDIPGRPDIVLPKYKTIIFVHGCFWHQHVGCKAAERPSSNVGYWNKKLDNNISRDNTNKTILEELGWKVFIIWECETKYEDILKRRMFDWFNLSNGYSP